MPQGSRPSKYTGVFPAGHKFGDWEVVTGVIIQDGEAKLQCRCKCGTERVVTVHSLTKGTSTCCIPCHGRKQRGSGNPFWRGMGKVPGSRVKKGVSSEAKQEMVRLYDEQGGRCAITNLPISFEEVTASLDRIDSTKGYEVGNMQWVHKNINVMKNGYELEYFIKMCHLVSQNNPEPPALIETNFVFGR